MINKQILLTDKFYLVQHKEITQRAAPYKKDQYTKQNETKKKQKQKQE